MNRSVVINKGELFPTPVFSTMCPFAKEIQQDITDLMYESEQQIENNYSGNGFSNYTPFTQFLDEPKLLELKSFIGDIVQQVHESLQMIGQTYHASSWGTIGRHYSHHDKHNHLPSLWSGVYYAKADQGDASLNFYDKNRDSNWPWEFSTTDNKYTAVKASVTPITGLLYIFPAYVEHSVSEQLIDRERITVAFNYTAMINEERK